MCPEESCLPQPGPLDHVHSTAKVAISAIPWVGGPGVELMNRLINPPLTKRREEFLASLFGRLESLEARIEGLKVESLRDNPEFVSAVMQATWAAIRTHSQEKLEALRNAVLNVAIGKPPDEDLREMLLHWVDALTPFHLQILARIGQRQTGPLELLPCLREWELARQAASELEADGLVGRRSSSLTVTAPVFGTVSRVQEHPAEYFFRKPGGEVAPIAELTELGKEFLAFIRSPDQGQGDSGTGE